MNTLPSVLPNRIILGDKRRLALPPVIADGENTFSGRHDVLVIEHGRRSRSAVVARLVLGNSKSQKVAGSIPAGYMIRWPAGFNCMSSLMEERGSPRRWETGGVGIQSRDSGSIPDSYTYRKKICPVLLLAELRKTNRIGLQRSPKSNKAHKSNNGSRCHKRNRTYAAGQFNSTPPESRLVLAFHGRQAVSLHASVLRNRVWPAVRVVFLLGMILTASASEFPHEVANRLADAIWHAEGGNSASTPYGVRGVKCPIKARQECLRPIRDAGTDIEIEFRGRTPDCSFIEYLAQRYAPRRAAKINENWPRNVAWYYRRLKQ